MFRASWPAADPAALEREAVQVVVQVDGRVRTRLVVPPEIAEDRLRSEALADEKVRPWLASREVARVVVVPGRLVNIVTRGDGEPGMTRRRRPGASWRPSPRPSPSDGCGYSLRTNLPPGIQSIHVPVLVNRTQEPGIEDFITQALTQAVVQTSRVRIAANAREADATLEGSIVEYRLTALSFDRSANVTSYRLIIGLALTFKDLKQNRVIWKQDRIEERADFLVAGPGDADAGPREPGRPAGGRGRGPGDRQLRLRRVLSWRSPPSSATPRPGVSPRSSCCTGPSRSSSTTSSSA